MIAAAVLAAAAARYAFTPSRVLAGATSAASNIIGQVLKYGQDWDKYNLESIPFDYALGVVSNGISGRLFKMVPASLTSLRDLVSIDFLKAFGAQQVVFWVYGMLVSFLRTYVSNADSKKARSASNFSNVIQAIKSVITQSIFESKYGKANIPLNFDDPRAIVISKVFDFLLRIAIQHAFDITPMRSPEITSDSGPGGAAPPPA